MEIGGLRLLGLAARSLLFLLLLTMLAAAALVAVLHYAPNRLAPLAERGASHILGRALDVGEINRVALGENVTIEAADLVLANAAWAGPEPMLSVGRLALTLNLPSLWRRGSILVRHVEIEALALGLLDPEDSAPNWEMGLITDGPSDNDALLPVVVEHAALDDISVSYSDPDQQVDVEIAQLRLERDEATGMSRLAVTGVVNEMPLSGGGDVGPTEALQSGRDLALDLNLTLGELEIDAAGSVADALRLAGADLVLDVRAPRSRRVLDMLGLQEVRDGPLRFQGRLADGRPGLLISAEGELADFGLAASGTVEQPAALDGIDLELYVDGPSMAEAGLIFGLPGFRDIPFDIAGKLHRSGTVLRVEGGRLRVGQGQLTLTGTLPHFPDIDDWQADIDAVQLDISVLGTVLGMAQLPQILCDIEGRLSSDESGVELVDLNVTDGDFTLVVDGILGEQPDFLGTDLEMRFAGDDLSNLRELLGLQTLPGVPYELAGTFSRDPNGWRMDRAVLQSQGVTLEASAELDRLVDPQRVEGRVSLASADLPLLLRGYGIDMDTIAPLPVNLGSEVRRVENGFDFHAFAGRVGAMEVSGRGFLSNSADFAGSRLRLEGRGDQFGEALSAFADANLPAQPFNLALDAVYHSPIVTVDRLALKIGAHSLSGHLALDPGDDANRARGQLELQGDNAKNLLALAGLNADVSDGAYRAAANLELSPDYLAVENLDADIVNSHLGGKLHLGFATIPTLDLDLYSRELHIPSLWPALAEDAADQEVSSTATEDNLMEPPTRAELRERLIPDMALPLGWINRVNGRWKYRIDRAWAREGIESRLEADLSIRDGVLQSRKLGWDGSVSKGWVELQVDAREPVYRGELRLASDRIPLIWLVAGRDLPDQLSTYRGDISFSGATLREAVASLEGHALLRTSGARLSNRGLDLVLGDVVGTVFDRLNPLTETQEYTEVKCLVGAMRAADGLLRIEPGMVMRTDALDMVSRGTVNLGTEALDITFNTRSRKGIGISAGKAITPYLKVAGNLANPWLTLDPQAVAVSGTAAIATGGLSMLAEGLYDRWVATARNPCREIFDRVSEDPDYRRLLDFPKPGLTSGADGA